MLILHVAKYEERNTQPQNNNNKTILKNLPNKKYQIHIHLCIK